MRVLTVRQPWAYAIVHLGKPVENRTRNIAGSYRGPVAIHAGLGTSPEAFDANALMQGQRSRRFDRGAVIGVVNLWAVHEPDRMLPGVGPFYCCPNDESQQWAMDDHYHLCLSNPRPIDPIPAKGRLGLWRPDPELQAQIEEALT